MGEIIIPIPTPMPTTSGGDADELLIVSLMLAFLAVGLVLWVVGYVTAKDKHDMLDNIAYCTGKCISIAIFFISTIAFLTVFILSILKS